MATANGPRILFIDIETAPDVMWAWGVYEQSAIAVKEHWYVLSYAAKWRGEKGVTVRGLVDFKGYTKGNGTEKKLLAEVHALLSEADIVVAHNGADFDVRKLNARFIALGFSPPSPYRVVDTKRNLTPVAKFSSNRLNWLCKQLGIGQKTMEHHDWKMWQGCMEGDRACWKEMKVYNAHDVVLLEELYEILAPWIEQPNATLWHEPGRPRCVNPACSARQMNINKRYYARSRVYVLYRCPTCGAWARANQAEKGSGAKIVPTPRRFS
jgi:uncharacterized protein YprB with RNaseH-like and TPR domain